MVATSTRAIAAIKFQSSYLGFKSSFYGFFNSSLKTLSLTSAYLNRLPHMFC